MKQSVLTGFRYYLSYIYIATIFITFLLPATANANALNDNNIVSGCQSALRKTKEKVSDIEPILHDTLQTDASYNDICVSIAHRLQEHYTNTSTQPYQPGMRGFTMTNNETGEKYVIGVGRFVNVMGEQFSSPTKFMTPTEDQETLFKHGAGCFKWMMSGRDKDANSGFLAGWEISFQTGRYKLLPTTENREDLSDCLNPGNPNPICYLRGCASAYGVMKRK